MHKQTVLKQWGADERATCLLSLSPLMHSHSQVELLLRWTNLIASMIRRNNTSKRRKKFILHQRKTGTIFMSSPSANNFNQWNTFLATLLLKLLTTYLSHKDNFLSYTGELYTKQFVACRVNRHTSVRQYGYKAILFDVLPFYRILVVLNVKKSANLSI